MATAKATIADVTALVAEALNWSKPWTTEQSERVAALTPYSRKRAASPKKWRRLLFKKGRQQ